MTNDLLYNMLSDDAFWMVNKRLAQVVGIEAALLLADLISREKYWVRHKKIGVGGGFFVTARELETDFFVKRYTRQSMQNELLKAGYLKIIKRGQPARNFFYLQHKKIIDTLSSVQNNDTLESRKPAHSDAENLHTSKQENGTHNKNNNKNNNKSTEYTQPIEIFNKLFSKSIQLTEIRKDKIKAYCNIYSVKDLCLVIEEFSKMKWPKDKKYGNKIWFEYIVSPKKRDELRDEMLENRKKTKRLVQIEPKGRSPETIARFAAFEKANGAVG